MMNDLKRQGFSFSKTFENSLKVTGTNATDAVKKANRLKGINKTALKQKITGYTADDGKKLTGSQARSEGIKIERKKKAETKKRRLTGLINVQSDVDNAVDEVWIVEDDAGEHHAGPGEQVDVSDLKFELINAFDDYRHSVPVSEMTINMLEKLHEILTDLHDQSQTRTNYDTTVQKAISILNNNEPVNPDKIGNDESMENIT